jgi:hypothetical protein
MLLAAVIISVVALAMRNRVTAPRPRGLPEGLTPSAPEGQARDATQ